jgi:hypothetical protein
MTDIATPVLIPPLILSLAFQEGQASNAPALKDEIDV